MNNDDKQKNVENGDSDISQNKGNYNNDVQMRLTGQLRTKTKSDSIVFSFELLMIVVTAIVVIPAEGTTSAPVYLKFKWKTPS